MFRRMFAADLATGAEVPATPRSARPPWFAVAVLTATLAGVRGGRTGGAHPAWVAAAGALAPGRAPACAGRHWWRRAGWCGRRTCRSVRSCSGVTVVALGSGRWRGRPPRAARFGAAGHAGSCAARRDAGQSGQQTCRPPSRPCRPPCRPSTVSRRASRCTYSPRLGAGFCFALAARRTGTTSGPWANFVSADSGAGPVSPRVETPALGSVVYADNGATTSAVTYAVMMNASVVRYHVSPQLGP